MTDKPTALRLADALEDPRMVVFWDQRTKAAAELRRLHAENEALRRLLQRAVDFEEGTRLPHWATPGWVADSIEEFARAEGSQK